MPIMAGTHRHVPSVVALLASLMVLFAGVRWGTFAVGGSDSYGYVSQAEMWAEGRLSVLEPRSLSMPWPNAEPTMVPLGYLMSRKTPGALVPIYPPGLPMVMGVFRRVAGRDGPFYVVPLLGALAVWLTFALGRSVSGPWAGALAAVLVAVSPIFLYQVTQPMSDVPASAWWLAALVLATNPSSARAAASGCAVSLAILTRPNLTPLAAVVAGQLLAESRVAGWRVASRRLALFALAALPAGLTLAWLNTQWYGAWNRFGYGGLAGLFSSGNVLLNFRRYGGWLVETHTPFVLLGLAAPGLLGRPGLQRPAPAWACWLFALGVFAAYLPYKPWGAWWFTRFLLPGLAPLLVLGVATAMAIATRALARRATIVVAVGVLALAAVFVRTAVERRAFDLAADGRRFREAGEWMARETAPGAIAFAEEHSGSVRYYSGRLTVDWNAFDPAGIDAALDALRSRRAEVYAVLDREETRRFRERFQGTEAARCLEGAPLAEFGGTRVFALHTDGR